MQVAQQPEPAAAGLRPDRRRAGARARRPGASRISRAGGPRARFWASHRSAKRVHVVPTSGSSGVAPPRPRGTTPREGLLAAVQHPEVRRQVHVTSPPPPSCTRTAPALEHGLLGDRVPRGERRARSPPAAGRPGASGQVAVVERHEHVPGADPADPRRRLDRARARDSTRDHVAVGDAQRARRRRGASRPTRPGRPPAAPAPGRSWCGCGSGRRCGRWSAAAGSRRRAPRAAAS